MPDPSWEHLWYKRYLSLAEGQYYVDQQMAELGRIDIKVYMAVRYNDAF